MNEKDPVNPRAISVAPGDSRHEAFVQSLRALRIGGRYQIDCVLGAGGMGLVAAASHPELEQRVAIKFMLPTHAADPTLNARFVREARLQAKVQSTHFVRVFDVGKLESGVPYMVMELLQGRDLSDELADRGPLPVGDAVDYVLQACAGLAELHALGIVHRDLKPSNLFLADVAGEPVVKVLDFGVSKQASLGASGPLTATDHIVGTPQYMSPEQIREARTVDGRSDVWSLGVILYELLTGQMPFAKPGVSFGELFGLIMFTDARAPRELRPDIPEALEEVVLRCLRRDPEERIATVAALAEALRPFTPAAALHRIDQVKRTLGKTPAAATSDKMRVAQEAPTPQVAVAISPTVVAKPETSSPVTVPQNVPARARPPRPVLDETPEPARKTGLVLAVAFVVAALIGVGFAVRATSASDDAAQKGTPGVSPHANGAGPQPAPTAIVSLENVPQPLPPPPAETPAASASSPPRPTVKAVTKPTAPRASAPAPAVPPTSPPKSDPSPGSLILDRK